jgi:osmotically-inducible protein OsmY
LWVTMAHSRALATTCIPGFEGQKAEPNPQIPATPQANAGSPLGQPNPAEDAALQGRIQQAFSNDPTLSTSHVSVSVTDSAIELTGTVDSTTSKETAERIAESFDGNRKFTDKLVVTGQNPVPPTGGRQK